MPTVSQNADLDMLSTSRILNLPDPTSAQQAATKAYVDAHGIGTFTASRALVTDSGGAVVVSSTTSAQIAALATLTNGRVPFSSGGVLTDSANATLDSSGNLTLAGTQQAAYHATKGLFTGSRQDMHGFVDSGGTYRWAIGLDASNNLYFNDQVNNKDVLTLLVGATYTTARLPAAGTLSFNGGVTTIGLSSQATLSNTLEVNRGKILANAGSLGNVLAFSYYVTGNVAATNYSRITGTFTSTRTATLPDADITISGSPAGLTASRAIASDANGLLAASATTATELGYLSGVTSAVQTQLNAKFGGTVAANQVAYGSGGSVLQGNSNFTYDGTSTTLVIENSAAAGDGIFKLGQSGIVDWSIKNQKTTANFLIASSSTGTAFRLDSATGNISTSNNTATAKFNVNGFSSSTVGQIIQLAVGQSVDAFQVFNSGGTKQLWIASDGISLGFNGSAVFRGINSNKLDVNDSSNSTSLFEWYVPNASGSYLKARGDAYFSFAGSTSNVSTAADLALYRNAAGILEINNGTAGTYRDLRVRYLGVGAPPSSSNPFYAYTNDSALSGTSILAKFEQLGTVTGNQTSNQIAIYGSMKTQAISAGITDSGYRRGFQLDMFLNTASFAGTLQEQTAGYANIGIYTATAGAVLNSSYGYRVVGYNNTASTTVALLYGFHSNLVGSTAGTVTTRHNFYVPDSVVANGTGQSGLTIGVLSGATNNTHLLLGTTTIPSGTYGAYIVSSAATAIPLTIKGAASQSGNYFNITSNSGSAGDIVAVTSSGLWTKTALDSVTNALTAVQTIQHNSTGTPAASFGSRVLFNLHSSTTTNQNAGSVDVYWTDATHATRTSVVALCAVNNAGSLQEVLKIKGDGTITPLDGGSFALGSTTGLKIGTSTSQKLGFFNSTPIVQFATTGVTSGFTAGGGFTVKDDSTFTGGIGSTAYRLSDIVAGLKSFGLLAA